MGTLSAQKQSHMQGRTKKKLSVLVIQKADYQSDINRVWEGNKSYLQCYSFVYILIKRAGPPPCCKHSSCSFATKFRTGMARFVCLKWLR